VLRTEIPGFEDLHRQPFSFARIDEIGRATHELDRGDAGRAMIEAMGDATVRERSRLDQIIEEAINSSVFEGAKLSTREQAAKMIREQQTPSSRGERMVLNNYRAMQHMLSMSERDLDLSTLLEVHRILGDGALEKNQAEGRLRRVDEDIRVEESVTGEVWYTPPPAEQLPGRLEKLFAFANGRGDQPGAPFIHPLLRGIVLHFWLAYEHPFVDGNGRMARALFYWALLRSGYDFTQYLSISGPIDRKPQSYYLAFAHSETDQADLTYFVLHQLEVLREATRELHEKLRSHAKRIRDLSRTIADAEELNDRQRVVLASLMRSDRSERITVQAHAATHRVTYLTARKDLQDLVARRLLRRHRVGRTDQYSVPTQSPPKSSAR
jgi:Fic family protein